MISSVCTALIAATFGFLAFAIEKRLLGAGFWLLLGFGILLLVLSIILGGRGVAEIEAPGRLFDLQAKSCLVGFAALVLSLFLLGPARPDETSIRLDSLLKQLGQLDSRVQRLEDAARIAGQRLEEQAAEVKAIRAAQAPVKTRTKATKK